MNERAEGFEINLQKLLLAYLHRWWLIALAATICAAGMLIYTKYFVTPLYEASTTIYVNNIKEGKAVESVSSSSLSASQQLVNTYINIVRSDRVMDKVAKRLGGNYSGDWVRSMVSATQVAETEIFAVSVTSPDPVEAATIANMIGEVVPSALTEMIEGSSAWVIDKARVPMYRCYPSFRRSVMVGGLAGGFLAAAYLTAIFLLDVRIKDEEELASLFDLPVLGQIPEFVTSGKSSGYGYGYGKIEKKKHDYASMVEQNAASAAEEEPVDKGAGK